MDVNEVTIITTKFLLLASQRLSENFRFKIFLYIKTVKGGENTQKSIQKKLLLISAILILSVAISGAASAAVDSNVTNGTTNANGITKNVTNLDGANNTINYLDMVNYTITVRNNELGPRNYRVNDVLPSGLQFISYTTTRGTYNYNTGVWDIGLLGNGLIYPSSATLNITAQVLTPGTSINNTAQAQRTNIIGNWINHGTAWVNFYVPVADISVDKTVNNTRPNVGQTIRYTFTVRNNGPDRATNVTVSDALPSDLSFSDLGWISYSGIGSSNVHVGGLNTIFSYIDAGGYATYYIDALVLPSAAGHTITNFAIKTAEDQFDPYPENDSSSATIYVPAANVELTKQFKQTRNGPAIIGANYHDIVWAVISLHNKGPDAATVTITDTPSGFTPTPANVIYYVSYNNGVTWTLRDGSFNSTTGNWTINIPSGSTYLLAIRGRVNQTGTVTNTAEQTAQDIGHTEPFESVTASLDVDPAARLDIEKRFRWTQTFGPNIGTANYRDHVYAVIRAINNGPDGANAVITDTSSGFTPISYSVSYDNGANWIGADGSFNMGTGEWTINIPDGARYLLALYGQITGTGTVTNTAEQTYQDVYNWTAFDSDAATLNVPAAVDMVIDKRVQGGSSSGTWNYNTQQIFWVDVRNNGPDTATNVSIVDTLPLGLDFDHINTYGVPVVYVWDSVLRTITWTFTSIGPGQTYICDLYVNVTGHNITLVNNASVNSTEYDWNMFNNFGNATVYIPPAADLWLVSKDVDDSTPDIGQLIKYTITVINNGPDAATDVTVTDLLPAGLTFDHYQATAGTYSSGIWSIPTLATNAVLEIWATVNTHPTSPSAINTAAVSSLVYDPNPNNNQESETIYFPAANITLSKEFRNSAWNVINTAHYNNWIWTVIKAHNNGPDSATNVSIQDALPAGLTPDYFHIWLSTDGGSNWILTSDYFGNIWTIANLPDGAEYWLAIWTQVTSTGDKINQADVTQLDQYYTSLGTANATLHVPQEAILTLTKEFRATIDGQAISTANFGQAVYAIVQLHNNGPDDATNININDVYNGFDYQGGYWINYGNGWIEGDTASPFDGADWTIPFLGNGQTIWLAIAGPVECTGEDAVNNTANQTTQDQYTPSLSNAFTSIDVPKAAYLTVTKEFRATYNGCAITQANYHNWIWTVLQAWNNGPDDVWAVIKDTPHSGLVLNNSGWYYSIDSGATWNLGDGTYSIYHPSTHEWRIWMPELTSSSNCYYLAIPTLVNQTGNLSNVVEQTWQNVYAPEPFDNNTVYLQVPPAADVFVKVTPGKSKLTVGGKMVVRVKVGNNGPDSAQNVVVTYKIPAGMEFVSLTHEAGYPAPTYDRATRTVTWNLGNLGVIDPWMDITLKAARAGSISSEVNVTSDTYDPVPANNVETMNIIVVNPPAKANAATVGMQHTGVPVAGLILAILAVFAGLVIPKRK